ncbi:unnamed protein product, partial [Symbiodinium natans]
MADGSGRSPLLDDAALGATAPPMPLGPETNLELQPSAPAAPLTAAELEHLMQSLPTGRDPLPTEQALRSFRTATAGKVVWAEQMRQLASSTAGGQQFFREAYERQLILDPEKITTADGDWASPSWAPSAPPLESAGEAFGSGAQAAQALLSQILVIRYDGRCMNLAANTSSQSWTDFGNLAASRMGDVVFDPSMHLLMGIGHSSTGVGVGSIVKVTGLTESPELNGAVGQVVKSTDSQLEVALPMGRRILHQDNVVPNHQAVVTRCAAFPLDLAKPVNTSVLRVLWLEQDARTPGAKPSKGPLHAIGAQYMGMSVCGRKEVSLGELRNFLWNLHLDDTQFAKVRKRFAPKGDYVDYSEVLYLLGRPHLQFPNVPVDALIYEAVVSILGRKLTAHIDRDLGADDDGIGYRNACRKHCASYFVSILLQSVIWVNLIGALVVWLFSLEFEVGVDTLDDPSIFLPAGIAYIIYLCHVACCVRLTRAFENQTEGIEQVMAAMDKPRFEDPYYAWHVQCYHYETRTRTRTNKDGQTETYTETVRVNTHSASKRGVIPSEDRSGNFLPNTMAAQTQIETRLDLNLSESNYVSRYEAWCWFHRWDVHQDQSRSEDLHSRMTSCLAVWSTRNMPCWLGPRCYWLMNLLALSFFFRILAQSRLGHQEYTYSNPESSWHATLVGPRPCS